MKAFILDAYKKGSALRAGTVPDPVMGENDVLVEIHAAGLNPLDGKIRDGEFKLILPYRTPLVLGHDLAGKVVRVGSAVRRFKPGDEVYSRPRDGRIGAFAELIAVDEADLALKPANLSMEEAASIPLVGLTAWQALVERARLAPGQKMLVHAGAGGVGTFAIQLAKHLGATVATTTSSRNAELVQSLGADVVIDYKTQSFETELADYDVVLSSLDEQTLIRSLDTLKEAGTLISISGPPDADFAREQGAGWFLRQLMKILSFKVRRLAARDKVRYSFLFMRPDGPQLQKITKLIEDGAIRPVIDRVYAAEDINDAISYVDSGRARGKVVIKMR